MLTIPELKISGVYRTTAQQLQQQQMAKGEGGLCQPELIRQEVQVSKFKKLIFC
jgi:hypothetical protein